MTERLNEFSVNLPALSVGGAENADSACVIGTGPAQELDTSIAIGKPAVESKKISVFANTITGVSYGDDDTVAAFDVVSSVGIFDGEGVSKTYQVVKRIGIDKQKIAAEAAAGQPVTVVESKIRASTSAATVRRARILAGLE